MSTRSPFALMTPGSKQALYLLGVLSAVKAVALVILAQSVATGITSAIAGGTAWRTAILWGASAAVLRAVIVWATQTVAARAALGAKEELRTELARRVLARGGRDIPDGVGAMTALATRGLDELDGWFTRYLPALVSAATIPLLIGARILWSDWVSALIIVLTIPLVPIFMILIGTQTQERVTLAADSLARLSDHLVELARGLPVLVGLGRAREQAKALREVSERYRTKTMATLRVAFLSSLALELIATISVAVVAVFIGVRLVSGELGLATGLLVLILAPECYLPFREVGTAHHASEDGLEALNRSRRMIASPVSRSPLTDGGGDAPTRLVVENLTIRYPDRAQAAVASLSFTVAPGEVVALTGPSGAGKSSVLAVLAGLLGDTSENGDNGGVRVSGSVAGIDRERLAWVPQHPVTYADTVHDEIAIACGRERQGDVMPILQQVGVGHLADRHPGELSPGELRRVAFGRALARVNAGATLLLLDEPTAHLDAVMAKRIQALIGALRERVTIVMVAHDPELRRLADVGVPVNGQPDALPTPTQASHIHVVTGSSIPSSDRTNHDITRDKPDHQSARELWRTLATVVQPWRPRFMLAIFFGVLAALSAVALTALSGWLIVRASQQPPILMLMVAIVGVRFFGIGRALFHYAERLWLHDAVFAALTDLRVSVWRALAARGAAGRRLLRGEATLDHLIGDVDRVRDLAPRVVLPPVVGVLTAVAATVTLGVLLPETIGIMIACSVLALVVAPLVALWADRAASAGQVLLRSQVLRRFAALFGAAADLRVNGLDRRELAAIGELDARASAVARRSAWALGLGNGIVTLACGLASMGMLWVEAPALASGTLSTPMVAVLVLTPLALIDPFIGTVEAVQQWPALRIVLARFNEGVAQVSPSGRSDRHKAGPCGKMAARLPSPSSRPERSGVERSLDFARDDGRRARGDGVTIASGERIDDLSIDGLAARWPGRAEPVFTSLTACVRRGQWLAVTGPSGAGKSTLLAVILGFLRPSAGSYRLNGLDMAVVPADRIRQHIAWCPQEAHLFDSSLRANLLLARSREEAPTEEEMRSALRRVGLGTLLDDLPDGLETRIGAQGSSLSGGQRQRVAIARTLLTGADVLLLDEPTAHLDRETADALMADLRRGLTDRIVVMVTHDPADIAGTDVRLDLTNVAASTPGPAAPVPARSARRQGGISVVASAAHEPASSQARRQSSPVSR